MFGDACAGTLWSLNGRGNLRRLYGGRTSSGPGQGGRRGFAIEQFCLKPTQGRSSLPAPSAPFFQRTPILLPGVLSCSSQTRGWCTAQQGNCRFPSAKPKARTTTTPGLSLAKRKRKGTHFCAPASFAPGVQAGKNPFWVLQDVRFQWAVMLVFLRYKRRDR